jgi:Fe/S biogenesis protein NfuA
MIKLTEEARSKISDALNRADPPRRHLRIRASVEAGAFAYHLEALTDEMVMPHDTVLECGEFDLVLDPDSTERLEGTRIDYRETLVESGFRFDNPNRPASPTLPTGERTDLEGPVPDRVRMLLDTEINPAIAAHGGMVQLVDVQDNRVYLAFGGGCHGCGMVDVTLKQGIETRIREAVPEVAEVIDTTDHSTGVNPYYQ